MLKKVVKPKKVVGTLLLSSLLVTGIVSPSFASSESQV